MPYDTKLPRWEEDAFRGWAYANGFADQTHDYDLRGAWRAGARANQDGHWPDRWKKPNHPTFSEESIYHGVDGHVGGRWVRDVFIPAEDIG